MTAALLLLTLLQATPPATAKPQTQPPPSPSAPAPATQAPRPRPSSSTTAMLFITDGSGRAIDGVTVNVMVLWIAK